MAEGGGDLFSVSVQKLDEELTCPVCHEHFEEPKVLPCLHCYCKKCVTALIARAPTGRPISCPECRREVQVVNNNPESLPTAFYINRIEAVFTVMTKAETTKEVKCENCNELPSVAFCQQCGEYICDDCVKAHKKMRQFSSHEVVSTASLRTSIKKSGIASVPIEAQELRCHKHKDEPLKLYCYTCHMLVCRDCTLVNHKDHKYAFIVDDAPQCKSTIKQKAELLHNVLPALKMVLKSLTVSEEKLTTHRTATIQAIDSTHNRIVSKLQQKRKELKAAATQKINASQDKITTGKKNAELAVAEVTSLYEFLNHNLERATDQELFSLLKQMSDQAGRATQLYADPPARFPVPTLPRLEVHCSEDVLQVLQEDIFIDDSAVPERVQKKGTVHKLTDQLEEMQQKMAECEAAWRKNIKEKEVTIVQLTAEKENLKREVEQLNSQRGPIKKEIKSKRSTVGVGHGWKQTTESKTKAAVCSICLEPFKNPVKTKCGHTFCNDCIHKAFQFDPYCPICKTPLRLITGNQPLGGTMTAQVRQYSLPGYEGCNTIEFTYGIPSGVQGPEHPNPGLPYQGTTRVAYLPANEEGRKVFELLGRAFNARLIFTVGTSASTGAQNQVIWNGIHHKTNKYGGLECYAYPDPTYLQRMKEDLAAKGIK